MVLFQLIEIVIIIIISKTVKMNFALYDLKFCCFATYVLFLTRASQFLSTSSVEIFHLCTVYVDTFITFVNLF
jgi:hypothetical protein